MPLFATLSATPAFAGRAFLTLFIIAAFGRFGTDLPILTDGVVASLEALPSWLTGDTSLIILGILAALEIAADKIPEAREALSFVDEYIKPTLSALITLQFLTPEFSETLSPVLGLSELGVAATFFPIAIVIALVAGGITWSIATTRNRILQPISDIDSGGETALATTISWLTDIGSLLFVVIAIIAPILGFALLVIVLALVALIRLALAKREKSREVTCPSCRAKHSVAAIQCPECHVPHNALQLGLLGLTVSKNHVVNTQSHQFDLLKWRRCPCCAEKLPKRELRQTCPRCKTVTFATAEDAKAYLNNLETLFSKAILLIALVGLIPVIGLVFGVIYGRIKVISGARIYLGRFTNWVSRLAVMLISFILLWFQAVPLFGALAVAAMTTVSFSYFRSRFRKEIERSFP